MKNWRSWLLTAVLLSACGWALVVFAGYEPIECVDHASVKSSIAKHEALASQRSGIAFPNEEPYMGTQQLMEQFASDPPPKTAARHYHLYIFIGYRSKFSATILHHTASLWHVEFISGYMINGKDHVVPGDEIAKFNHMGLNSAT